jgi:hypothetical protein
MTAQEKARRPIAAQLAASACAVHTEYKRHRTIDGEARGIAEAGPGGNTLPDIEAPASPRFAKGKDWPGLPSQLGRLESAGVSD